MAGGGVGGGCGGLGFHSGTEGTEAAVVVTRARKRNFRERWLGCDIGGGAGQGCGIGGEAFGLGNVGTGIDGTPPPGLADADRETEGCGQQMVAEAVGFANAVEVLHGGHAADFGGEGKAAGEVVLGLDAVGNGKGLVGIVLVVEDAEADEGNEAPSGDGMDVFLVLRAEDIPKEIGTEVLVML